MAESDAEEPSYEEPGLCPALDAASVHCIAKFVHESDYKAFLSVCSLWLSVGTDPKLPFWRELDLRRWELLGPSPFCCCRLSQALRRCRVNLERLDLRGAVACERCPRAPPGGDAACTAELWTALLAPTQPWPALRELDASVVRHARSLPPSDATFLSRATPRAGAKPPLPALRVLRLAGAATLDGSCLPALWKLAPGLEELCLARCPHLHVESVATLAAWVEKERIPLRLNLLDEEPMAACIDVRCGVCEQVLWTRLSSYCMSPRSQQHIDAELFTSVPPDPGALVPSAVGGDDTLTCRAGCHRRHRLYLVDHGSGIVDMHGYSYAVACGEGRQDPAIWNVLGNLPALHQFLGNAAPRNVPPLARIVPVQ